MLAPVNLRFAELIQALGVNKNAFAQSLGKTASVVQHLIDGRNKPGYDLLCKVFEISKDWLMEGRGPMLLAGAPEIAIPAASAAFASPAVALKKAAGAAPLFAASAAFAAPAAEETPIVAANAPLPAPVVPAVVAAPAPAADAAIGAALQTQHLLHQLALAEQRNHHLQEQQQLLRQMLELAQRR